LFLFLIIIEFSIKWLQSYSVNNRLNLSRLTTKMGDQFDPCECINLLNQEQRMQRLISMLRDSQSVCNDNECFNDVLTGPSNAGVFNGGNDGTQLSFMTLMIGWMIIAMILYFMRPSTWLRRSDTKKNPNNGGGNGGRDPDHQFVLWFDVKSNFVIVFKNKFLYRKRAHFLEPIFDF